MVEPRTRSSALPKRAALRATRAAPATAEPGIGVDAYGGGIIDPTRNVLDLVEREIARLNDLANAAERYGNLLDKRQDDLRIANEQHSIEQRAITRAYEQRLSDKETQRIDAINAQNLAAVSAAAEVQRAQATLLANQVATTGETLRAQVSTAATTTATTLATTLEPLIKAIDDLRRVQYEQQGQKAQQLENRVDTRAGNGMNMQVVTTLIAVGGFVLLLIRDFAKT